MRAKRTALVCAVWALALIAPAVGRAATFTVNTTADTSVAGGCTTDPACSLRDALAAAGSPTDPEDVVVVPAGNYSVENGQLAVAGSGKVTIRGAGARSTTIDAHGSSRVIEASTETTVIEGVTITGGNAAEVAPEELPGDGGGVLAFNAQELVLDSVVVAGNTAAKNGAGVAAPPENTGSTVVATDVKISNSTISGNQVTGGLAEGLGGGIYVLGDLTLTNSTVSGNHAESTAGMVQGGGVLAALDPTATEPSDVVILNSTIAGNSVGATGTGGGLAVYNPTPGVETALSVKNTIVAGNTGPAGPSDCGAVAMVASANNISSDTSCMFTDPGSKQNTNPQLGALANNGGQTDTMALPAGSPALEAGTNTGCPATDQRGVKRPQGATCDIGAFEREVAPPAPLPPAAKAADLRLRIKAKPKKPKGGHGFAFLLTVANRGPAAATGVVVKGTVPAAAKRAAGKKIGGKKPCKLGKAKKGKRQLTCKLGTIAAGASAKVKVLVKPKRAGKLKVRARVRSGVADPNLKDNKARASVRLKAGGGPKKK